MARKKQKKDEVKKPHISPSQLSTYTRCGEQYRRRYVEKEIIPPGIALMKGSSVHKGAEENFKHKMEKGEDMNKDDVAMICVETFDNIQKNEGILLNDDELAIGKKKVVGEAKDVIVDMANLFSERVAPRYIPKSVEKEYNIELPNSTHNIKAITDLETEFFLVDLKTSGKQWSQRQADSYPNFTVYSMVKEAQSGKAPQIMVENLHGKKKISHTVIETRRTKEDYERMINRINRVLDGINGGVFAPANDGGWWCHPNYCGYFHSCKVRP